MEQLFYLIRCSLTAPGELIITPRKVIKRNIREQAFQVLEERGPAEWPEINVEKLKGRVRPEPLLKRVTHVLQLVSQGAHAQVM